MMKFGVKNAEQTQDTNKSEKTLREKIWALASHVLMAVLIAVIVFNLVFFISRVPTGSMIPTISEGARIVVQKIFVNYDYEDIVVFYSDEFDAYLVKRLIGKPGDKITITENEIFRNGEKLEEKYLVEDYVYEMAEFEIPDNCYFFLGDNRDESIDAREWDNPYISKDKLLGEVAFIFN